MSKKIRKIIFPGTTLIISFYLSILFTIGIIAGYLGTTLFHRRIRKKRGKVKGISLPFRKWEIHLHHWILGSLGIIITYFFSSLSIFWLGVFGGLVFHDIYTDKKWYRVIYRK